MECSNVAHWYKKLYELEYELIKTKYNYDYYVRQIGAFNL